MHHGWQQVPWQSWPRQKMLLRSAFNNMSTSPIDTCLLGHPSWGWHPRPTHIHTCSRRAALSGAQLSTHAMARSIPLSSVVAPQSFLQLKDLVVTSKVCHDNRLENPAQALFIYLIHTPCTRGASACCFRPAHAQPCSWCHSQTGRSLFFACSQLACIGSPQYCGALTKLLVLCLCQHMHLMMSSKFISSTE